MTVPQAELAVDLGRDQPTAAVRAEVSDYVDIRSGAPGRISSRRR
jgi:hypothetical protein